MPVTARARPPRNGPTNLHFIPLYSDSSICCALDSVPASSPITERQSKRRAVNRIDFTRGSSWNIKCEMRTDHLTLATRKRHYKHVSIRLIDPARIYG